MQQILVIIGSALYLILGVIHLSFTLFSNKFDAFDNHVNHAMKGTSPVITKDTTMWQAWIGFNVSHSLGMVFIGSLYLSFAIFNSNLLEDNIFYLYWVLFFSCLYLVTAKKYWFKVPFIGIFLATICFLGALIVPA